MERRPNRTVLKAASLLFSPPSANHRVGTAVESGKKMALNQRTTNHRLWSGKHVQAHVRLHTSRMESSGLCSHQCAQARPGRKEWSRAKTRRSGSAVTSFEAPRFSMSGSQPIPGVCHGGYATSPGKGPGMERRWFPGADAPRFGGPGSHQRAHKSPTAMGCSGSLYYLLVLFTSSASALN